MSHELDDLRTKLATAEKLLAAKEAELPRAYVGPCRSCNGTGMETVPTRECIGCGELFALVADNRGNRRKYCSEKCRWRCNKARHRAEASADDPD